MNGSTLGLKIKENLLFLTKKHNISEAELARKVSLPQATVNRLLNGVTDDPRASTLNAIATFFNISVDQLINNKLMKESTLDTTRLPIYAMSQDNSLLGALKSTQQIAWDTILSKKDASFLEVEPSIKATCIVFEVKGDSMWPQFIEGIFVIVDTTSKPKHRDFVMYLLSDSSQIVLRQYIEEGQDHILKPLNYGYKPVQIHQKDIYIGTVIQAKSDYRES
ncbi:MAG: S24 family peptidase [Gammaproteobacteria bacterium]